MRHAATACEKEMLMSAQQHHDDHLSGTSPARESASPDADMVRGIHRHLDALTRRLSVERRDRWRDMLREPGVQRDAGAFKKR